MKHFTTSFRAMTDCLYVLHIASPCEVIADERIVEVAIRGTLNVLSGASRKKCVRKVVLTSTSGAINFKFIFLEVLNFFWLTALLIIALHVFHLSYGKLAIYQF